MMSRASTATIAFAAGMATVLLALSLMFHTTPGVILADDMLPALSVAADRPLKHFPPGSRVYVKSALGPMFLEALRSRYPSLTLRPYSERTERPCADGDPARDFRHYVDMNVEAEALGFHSTFLVEHHFTGIGQVSASLDLLAWVAARTTTLRLGTAVIVLPWHDPVLLAERAATLDLTYGRCGLIRSCQNLSVYDKHRGVDASLEGVLRRRRYQWAHDLKSTIRVVQRGWNLACT